MFTRESICAFLKKHEPFDELSDACLEDVSNFLTIESHKGDTCLIKQGEKRDDLYILIKGRLFFNVKDREGNTTYQGELNEGAIIGEMALLSNAERTADVYTLRDSIILKLTKQDFLTLCQTYPELLNKLTQFTIKRLTLSLQGINKTTVHNQSIAIIPLHPMADFEVQLRELIDKSKEKIILLTSEYLAGKGNFLDEDGYISQDKILLINHLEEKYSFIFYLADSTESAWTKFCIRQADALTFVVGAEEKDPGLRPVEKLAETVNKHFVKRRTLIFLHHSPELPKNTADWLNRRAVNNHFHIRMDTQQGRDRLLRVLTDKTIALVLSGGGARGLAHIGVIRLLEEKNIPIDFIAGSSMGSLLSGLFAKGFSSDDAQRAVNEFLIKGAKIDYTFPYISIASGKRATAGVMHTFGDAKIEDLWLNYFCVSTDLISQQTFVHRQGLVWKSIRSSISLPFIYPPVAYEGKLLLDGGVLNNIPIDVMHQITGNSKIIASNIVGNSSKFKLTTPLPLFLSGWKLLYNKLRGQDSLHLNVGELVFRLLTISSQQNSQKTIALADKCFVLSMGQFGMLDFKSLNAIIQFGYEEAKHQFGPEDQKLIN